MAGGDKRFEGALAMNAVDICGLPTISVGITDPKGEEYEVLNASDPAEPSYRKIVLLDDRIVGAIFLGRIDRAGIITGLIRERVNVSSIKKLLLSDEFGVIALPAEYRKHLVSGSGIEV
jgi:NAD(P)H-nitrite reductase large subunit